MNEGDSSSAKTSSENSRDAQLKTRPSSSFLGEKNQKKVDLSYEIPNSCQDSEFSTLVLFQEIEGKSNCMSTSSSRIDTNTLQPRKERLSKSADNITGQRRISDHGGLRSSQKGEGCMMKKLSGDSLRHESSRNTLKKKSPNSAMMSSKDDSTIVQTNVPVSKRERAARRNSMGATETSSAFANLKNFGTSRLSSKKKKGSLGSISFDSEDSTFRYNLIIVTAQKAYEFEDYYFELTLEEFLAENSITYTTEKAVNYKGEIIDFKIKLINLTDFTIFIITQSFQVLDGISEYIFMHDNTLACRSLFFRKRSEDELKDIDNFLNSYEIKSCFKRQLINRKKKTEKQKEEALLAKDRTTQKSFLEDIKDDYKDSELTLHTDKNGEVKVFSATIDTLIEILTHEKGRDKNFEKDFILSFDSILTPVELFQKTTNRYKNGSVEVKQHVLEIYKLWISKRKYCFQDLHLKNSFLVWFEILKYTDFAKENYLDKRLIMGFTLYVDSEICTANRSLEMAKIELALREEEAQNAPDILVFHHDRSFEGRPDFLDFHPFEFARQVTIIDSKLLLKIKTHEWIGKGLSSGESVNLIQFVNRFNHFSGWVATMICLGSTAEIRGLMIKFFLACALELLSLNNFNSAMAVVSALSMGPVARLLQSWNSLGNIGVKWFDLVKELMGMEKNFKKLRSFEETAEYCIPYLGMYTKDLIFIEDGNPDTTEEGLINFDKRHMVASVIAKMEHFGSLRYSLAPVREIQQYLETLNFISEDDLYTESFQRETKDTNAKLREKNAKKGIH